MEAFLRSAVDMHRTCSRPAPVIQTGMLYIGYPPIAAAQKKDSDSRLLESRWGDSERGQLIVAQNGKGA